MRSYLLKLLQTHNPCYLLSALFMLAGCLTLNRALEIQPGHIDKLIILVAALQLYEILLIALALFLIVHRELMHDGKILLLLKMVFLVNATYINAECCTADPLMGAIVNAITLILVVAKLGVIVHIL